MNFNEPAGWIPPQYRELIYAGHLSEADLEAIQLTTGTIGEDGIIRPFSAEKVAAIRRVIGVRDTRDGSEHFNQQSTTSFLSAKIERSE